MLVKLSKINLNVEISRSASDSDYIFFLHGFTGSSCNWDVITESIKGNFTTIAVDLIGHGKSDSPSQVQLYDTDSIVEQLNELFNHFSDKQIFLIGYSMGGRAAISYAAKYPQKIKGLILEGSSAGIEDEKMRSERIADDKSLADFIESHSLIEFVDYWLNLDLFNTQRRFSNEKRNQIRKEKLQNNKTGLANMLRGFGTGQMPRLQKEIKKILPKTLLITGELDTKFTQINLELLKLFPSAKHIVIKNAGHNTHLEEPKEFIRLVNHFLNKF